MPEMQEPQRPVTTGIGFAFEMGLQKIADQIQVFDALDSKVGVILAFIVVSIAEILGFLILAAAEGLSPNGHFSKRVVLFFFAGLICTVIATICGLLALGVRRFALGFKFAEMVRKANRSADELQLLFLDDVRKSCEFNSEALDQKQKYSRVTVFFVVLGLAFYSLATAVLFLGFVPKG